MDGDAPNDGRIALVTGAAGFIASHLVEALQRDGWQVRALVRYGSSGSIGWLDDLSHDAVARIDLRRGDLLDAEFVAACCEGVDTVFHLGARIAIPYSYQAPRDTVQVNVTGTQNVLEGVRRHGVRRLVHASTSEVFGTAVTVPMDESHRQRAQSVYAGSKIAADRLVESYVCSFGLPAVIIRPFNTFGPRQSPRAVISTVIDQALAGGDIRLGALWPQRDFTYVLDTVDGFVRAASAASVDGEEINLGTGRAVSIADIVETITAALGVAPSIIADDTRRRPESSEVGLLLSDNRKAKRLLGWEPKVTLEDGLRLTIDWWRNRRPHFAWQGYAV